MDKLLPISTVRILFIDFENVIQNLAIATQRMNNILCRTFCSTKKCHVERSSQVSGVVLMMALDFYLFLSIIIY